ncbi:SDR family NAD(P)-dependent oxidoreductase [Rhodococcus sp. T2V]|uniref:SDR family NAD(P)-dependent oxidoreductase n=1 Tax=Rhodococcus sp. T2V TaxID=3034164 RepID=UPI0023E09A9C|nr:SDR family NAD(P)-dependent oxidoreductase [Rhodococcus sp. T2V]MDF3310627.1 SDR family NAD(P)-dependent oxidoreductase [Rhodococcus sp. T2V]
MDPLQNRVAVITGAGGGIGAATSVRLAAEGYRLALLDYSDEAVAEAERVVRNEFPDTDILGVRCDVADESSVAAAAETIGGWTDKVHAVALVAGVLQQAYPVEELPLKEFDRVIDVNVRGVFLLTRALVPMIPAHDGGSLTAIASWSGQLGSPYFTAYCASKAAVIVFMQSVASELAGRGIRANSVCPGNIATSMHTDALQVEADQRGIAFDEMKSIEWAKIPLGYAGPPSTIADAVAFLSSDRASYITGTALDVNGGVHFR